MVKPSKATGREADTGTKEQIRVLAGHE